MTTPYSLRIKSRNRAVLVTGMLLLSFLNMVVGYMAYTAFGRMDAAYREVIDSSSLAGRVLQQLTLELANQHRAYLNLLLTQEKEERIWFRDSLTDSLAEVDRLTEKLRTTDVPEFRKAYDGWQVAYADYSKKGEELMKLIDGNRVPDAVVFRRETMRPAYAAATKVLTDFSETVSVRSRQVAEEMSLRNSTLSLRIFAGFGWPLVAMFLSVVAIFVLSFVVLKTLLQMLSTEPS